MRLTAAMAIALACAGNAVPSDKWDGQFEKTLNVSGAADLDIATDSGGILVRGGQPGSVQVHAFLKASRGRVFDRLDVERRIRSLEQNPPIEQTGNRIRIGHVRDKELLRGVSIRFEVVAPVESSVRARADSGGILVESLKGPVDCQADSGGIEARDIGAEVRAKADSGGINIRNVRGSLFARADSGGIEAMGISGPIDIAVDSGGIQVQQNVAAPVRLRADSGGATIKLASNSGYDVRAKCDSCRISVPKMTVSGNLSPTHVEGKIREGGPLVDVSVDSGNVTIE
jgi:hypothetical protein